MIKIVMEGMCEDCEVADLELTEFDRIIGTREWSIRCRHRASCERILKWVNENRDTIAREDKYGKGKS